MVDIAKIHVAFFMLEPAYKPLEQRELVWLILRLRLDEVKLLLANLLLFAVLIEQYVLWLLAVNDFTDDIRRSLFAGRQNVFAK